MTIGDVLAVVAVISFSCLAAWTLLVSSALLFPGLAKRGQNALEQRPWRTVLVGFMIAVSGIAASITLMNLPNGFVKLMGWALLLALLSLGALGSGGVAKMLAQRVQNAEPGLSSLGAILRGGALPVVASLLPLVGWFVVLPLGISASLGAGWVALRSRKPRPVSQTQFVVAPQPETPLASTHIAPQI